MSLDSAAQYTYHDQKPSWVQKAHKNFAVSFTLAALTEGRLVAPDLRVRPSITGLTRTDDGDWVLTFTSGSYTNQIQGHGIPNSLPNGFSVEATADFQGWQPAGLVDQGVAEAGEAWVKVSAAGLPPARGFFRLARPAGR